MTNFDQKKTSKSEKTKVYMDTPNPYLEVASCISCYDDFPEAGKVVPCACGAKVCQKCVKTYILTQDRQPHCMSCENSFATSFCIEYLGKPFMSKTYRNHLKNILFSTEKSRFPETMPNVVREKTNRTYHKDTVELRKKFKEIVAELEKIKKRYELSDIERIKLRKNWWHRHPDTKDNKNMFRNPKKRLKKVHPGWFLTRDEYNKLIKKQKDIYRDSKPFVKPLNVKLTRINKKINAVHKRTIGRLPTIEKTKSQVKFTQKCSVEDCEGFLTDKWVCELCNQQTCRKCLETKNDDHVCNPDNVETAKFIKKTTRNCPGCATSIHKIHGCDQMWCTQCNVPFSYKSGKKINGPVHNPHFFQWLKDNPGANPQQNMQQNRGNQCRDPMNIEDIQFIKVAGFVRIKIYEFFRLSLHFRDTVLNKALDREVNNLDLRIKFMIKDQNEKSIKRTLFTRQNKRNKELEFIRLFEFMATIMVESFFSIKKKNSNIETLKILEEVEEARLYCNKELKKISVAYGHKPQVITKEYNLKYITSPK